MTMDAEIPSGDHVEPGISIRNGPMDVDEAPTNGANGKRKSRGSLTNGNSKTYKEASSSEDEKPLVRPSIV
jgi:DNA topoisomerase-1